MLILHVSRMTKITVTLFTIISTYSPWRQTDREARSTVLQPIRLTTGRVVVGRDCIVTVRPCFHLTYLVKICSSSLFSITVTIMALRPCFVFSWHFVWRWRWYDGGGSSWWRGACEGRYQLRHIRGLWLQSHPRRAILRPHPIHVAPGYPAQTQSPGEYIVSLVRWRANG